MAAAEHGLRRTITNLWSTLLSLIFVLLGTGLLYWAGQNEWWDSYKGVQSLVRDFGSLFVVLGVVTILWEVAGRRALFDEFWAKARLAESVRAAGLRHVARSFRADLDWPTLLRETSKLDVFVAYARTWRNTYAEQLEHIARKEDGRIRIILPDPDDHATMAELARRFSMTPADMVRSVNETAESFLNLRQRVAAQRPEKIQLWYLPSSPVFTFYRLDNLAVVALYTHRRGREPVPAFLVESGGYLYDFVRDELDSMVAGDHPAARKVAQ